MSILNLSKLVDDISDRKIFLGEYSGFQRFDQYKYPFAKAIERKMRQAFWNPEEISLNTDRVRFPELPKAAQEVIIRNLLFQTLMDSAQSRGLDAVMVEATTSPEWEAVFKTQGYFEEIHSISYSHILLDVFPDATAVFDSIEDYDEIKHRVDKEVEAYSELLSYISADDCLDEVKKRKILEMCLRIYALEGLKFYVSFLVTYIINNSYNNKIQGITRIIKLINFDEDMHVSVFAGLLNILRKNKDEGFADIVNSKWFTKTATDIFTSVVEDEIEWGKYLMSFGNIPSLTEGVLDTFVKFYANNRLEKLNIIGPYNVEKSEMVTWFETYKDIDKDNVAGQESEGLAYNIGILKNDLPEGPIKI